VYDLLASATSSSSEGFVHVHRDISGSYVASASAHSSSPSDNPIHSNNHGVHSNISSNNSSSNSSNTGNQRALGSRLSMLSSQSKLGYQQVNSGGVFSMEDDEDDHR
jgi:hypothetical protein